MRSLSVQDMSHYMSRNKTTSLCGLNNDGSSYYWVEYPPLTPGCESCTLLHAINPSSTVHSFKEREKW